jgi:hypothetical protein
MRQHLAKSLDHPDEVYRFPGVVQNAVVLGDIMVARSTAEPGWRWSKDMQPLVGGEWCQARHVGTIVSDEFVFMLPDGTRTELHPGDVYDIPPGHDGFTLGDEPCTVIEWAGVRAFAGFRAGVTGRHLATLLITDVVDSTAIASRLGDIAWNDTVALHFEMARTQLEEFNGREVNTTGDGMFVTFDSPVHALRCAALRQLVNAQNATDSTSAPACTSAKSKSLVATFAGSRCTKPLASWRLRNRTRSSSPRRPAPCRSHPVSPSMTGECTR